MSGDLEDIILSFDHFRDLWDQVLTSCHLHVSLFSPLPFLAKCSLHFSLGTASHHLR